MKKVSLFALILALLIGVIPFVSLAEGSSNSKQTVNQGPETNNPLAQLNLTADQKQKIITIQQKFGNDNKASIIEMQKKQIQLQQLWDENQLNQQAIEAKDKELIALRIQLVTKSRAMVQQIINSVLTPEQRTKYQSIVKSQIPAKTVN